MKTIGRYAILLSVSMASMMAGGSVVHNIFKPDTNILTKMNQIEAEMEQARAQAASPAGNLEQGKKSS